MHRPQKMMEIVPVAKSKHHIDGMCYFKFSFDPDDLKETSNVLSGCTLSPSLILENEHTLTTTDWKTWNESAETVSPHLM